MFWKDTEHYSYVDYTHVIPLQLLLNQLTALVV